MAMKDRLNIFDQKLDKILEKQSNLDIKLNRCYHTLYGDGEKGLVEKVEDLEKTTSTHSKYFWLINIIYTTVGSVCVFIINKIWK